MKTHNIFVDGVVLAWLSLVHEVMRCAVDAEHKVLLERPGCDITRELRVSGLVASAKKSGFRESCGEESWFHARRKRLVRIVIRK